MSETNRYKVILNTSHIADEWAQQCVEENGYKVFDTVEKKVVIVSDNLWKCDTHCEILNLRYEVESLKAVIKLLSMKRQLS